MTTINATGNGLTGANGSGSFVGSTSPTITTPRIAQINDSNGNKLLGLVTVASAVNSFNIYNQAAGSSPTLQAVGSDTDVGLTLLAQAAGPFSFNTTASSAAYTFVTGTGYQHLTQLTFANTSATRTVTFPDATGTLLMTGQAISTVPSIAFSSTSGVIGTTTNDNAAAGSVGELLSAIVLVGSAVSVTANVSANIVTLSLTAGDWDVWGELWLDGDNSTIITRVLASITLTSSTIASVPAVDSTFCDVFGSTSTIGSFSAPAFPTGACRISVASTTNVYLVANVGFTISTATAYGKILARRVR
jgi:hypothetical protein